MILKSRIISFILALFLCDLAFCQVTEIDFMFNVTERPFMQVDVLDKETGTCMEGASVFLSWKTDTVKAVTNLAGKATFPYHPFGKADSVNVDISFLGYKKISYRQVMKPVVALEAKMEEDPLLINAIIVKDDRITMVRHGDTTVYNASAFAMMEDAKLADLLKKLPGIKISDTGISAYGEKVSKILINGTMLFGNNVTAAMDMLRSEEVRKVKVYDEYAQDRLIEKDTLGRKERVVDIETKKPITRAQELALIALGGVYIDNNSDIGGYIGAVEENWRSFAEGKMSYIVEAGAGRNYDVSGQNSIQNSPGDNVYGGFSLSKNRKFKSNTAHWLSIDASKSESSSSSYQVYNPTESFSEKSDHQTTENTDRWILASYNGSQGISILKNSSLDIGIQMLYNRSKAASEQVLQSVTDGKNFLSNKEEHSLKNKYNASIDVRFSHLFEKKGRKLTAAMDYNTAYGRGDGDRVDTMKTSSAPQWLTIGQNNSSNTFKFQTRYEEPVAGENFRLNLAYNLSGNFSSTKKLAFDELLMQNDVINTQDFTHRNIENNALAGIKWLTSDKTLDISADVRYIRSDQLHNERLPVGYLQPKTYQQVSPAFSLRYSKNPVSLNIGYSESMGIPSIEQTTNVMDNSSQAYLKAGNPSLDASVNRSATVRLSATSFKTGSVFSFNVGYSNTSDCIVSNTRYFTEDTYLPEYDYTATAGSSLTIPINAGGASDLNSRIGWDGYINALKSSFSTFVDYRFSRRPFSTDGLIRNNDGHDLGLSLTFMSGFSKYIDLMISADAHIGRTLVGGNVFYDSFSFGGWLNAKVHFLKHFWLGCDFRTSLYRSTKQGFDRNDISWDMDLTYKFGKKRRSELTLACEDILDSSLNILRITLDDYVKTIDNTVFGRSLTLSYKYTFR